MAHVSRRYRAALGVQGYDATQRYDVGTAIDVLARFPKPKFDETVEMAFRLGVDPKRSDQIVRGSVSLPKGIGKQRVVAVFAEGPLADEARAAGADHVGGDDLAQKMLDGWTEFEVCIAHPSMMKVVGKLGRVLGPQGKMPSPKSGTVTPQIAQAVREFKAGKVEFRADAGGIVHVPVGKRSFAAEDLAANVNHMIEHIRALRPAAVRGAYIRKVSLSATMSPSLTLDIA